MTERDALPSRDGVGTIGGVTDDATTQVMLEALFDIRAAVYEIHDVLIQPPEDGDEETSEDDT